jgi:VWFA-related protein
VTGSCNASSLLCVFLVISAALACLGQEAKAPPSQEPVTTFQSTTRLVVLDVVVTDKQGKPVRNLSKDDFTIFEDDKPQTIDSFEAPDQHAPVPIVADGQDSSTNLEIGPPKIGAQPLTILVFDALDSKIVDQAYARAEINKYLAAHGPTLTQPTALMALEEKRLELLHDYTRDAKALEQALRQHKAQLPFRLLRSMGEGNAYSVTDRTDAEQRLVDAMLALREIATANTQFAGRKNVVWIGPGFPSLNGLRIWNEAGFRGLEESKVIPNEKANLLSWEQQTLELIWNSRISVYTIDPRGREAFPEEAMTPASGNLVFEQIAPLTGGRIIGEANDVDARIAKSVDEGGAYYAMAYYPVNRDWKGKFRRVRIALRNPELIAHTRDGYYAVPNSTATPRELNQWLSLAVLNPLSYHSLEVQARARLSGSQPRTAHITVNIDANELHWETPESGKHRCEITIVTAGFSTKGEVVAHAIKELEVVVDEKKQTQLLAQGMVMQLAMLLPPTAVRIRIVARDSTNGNVGTADLTPEGEQFH